MNEPVDSGQHHSSWSPYVLRPIWCHLRQCDPLTDPRGFISLPDAGKSEQACGSWISVGFSQ